jgi:protein O-mannosyl-transferase
MFGRMFDKHDLYSTLIIIIIAFLLYGNSIRNDYSLDDSYVTQNNTKVQKGIAGIPKIFTSRYVDQEGNSFGYRPVAMASFAIEYQLWGQNPHASHLINVLLYTLILLILFKTLRKTFVNINTMFVLSIVLLFAAHPIHTEVVDSLKNRETLLSFLFSLTSLYCFLKWFDHRYVWTFIAGLSFFILAFLSKQDSITFAAVIPMALYYSSSSPSPDSNQRSFLKSLTFNKKVFIRIVILLGVLGIAGILIYKIPGLYLPAEDKVVYNFENPLFVRDPNYSKFPFAFYTLFFYLSKLLWPHPLGFYYGYKMIPEVGWSTSEVIFSASFHAVILIFALWKLPKKHILSFAVLYYLATISIFSNIFIKIPGIVAERLVFFPSLGFCIALTYGIFRLLKIDIQAEKISRKKLWVLLLVMLLFLLPSCIKTINRNSQWKDYLTLYTADIDYLSNSAKANSTYAAQLLKEAFNNDVKNPGTEIQNKYLDLADKHLKQAVKIDSTFIFAWNNLGFITYQYLGKKKVGIYYMEKAVKLDPDYVDAHFNLGYAYKEQKFFEKSIYHFHEAQRINPDKAIYYSEEADTWLQAGNRGNALNLYNKASEIDLSSDLPLINMGNIYWLSGDTVLAIENWEKAFKRNPDNLDLCLNLVALFTGKDNTKATFYKSKALKLQQKTRYRKAENIFCLINYYQNLI